MLDDTHAVEAALAILRASGIDISSPRDGDLDDLEHERFSAVVDSCRTYARALSTVTPAEVGGHADTQTEARAIARRVLAQHGFNNPFGAEESACVDAIATALAAKDAELAEVHQRYVDANEARIDAEAQLAEANKALEQAEQQLDYGQVDAAHRIIIRAREAQGGA